MKIEVAFARGLRSKSPLDVREIRAAAQAALEHGARRGAALSIAIVDDAEIARLHGLWFDDPTPTDVISFELGGDDGPAGELYVSLDTALRSACERRLDPRRELALYVVHGALHLCGFDDTTTRGRAAMRAAERAVLARWSRAAHAHEATRSHSLNRKTQKN